MGQDCKYCGAYISGRAEKCPACGKKISYKAENDGFAREEEKKDYTYNYSRESVREEKKAEAPKPKAPEDEDVKANKGLAYLCYFGPLLFIPYFVKPESAFIKYHANQGLVLLIASVVGGILAGFVPALDGIAELVVDVFVFVCFVKGLINVNRGLKVELPLIGGIKVLK